MLNTSISTAVLYRIIEQHGPTMLIDEFDTFMKNDDLRGILNAGYTRDTTKVPRCVGDDHKPREFSVWAAKAFTLIGRLPATLDDRTIVLRMKRRLPTEKVERLRSRDRGKFNHLRAKCMRFANDCRAAIQQAEPLLPEKLNDRAQDIWEPLLTIADTAGGKWPKRARRAAIRLSGGEDHDNEPVGIQLLADVCEFFEKRKLDRVFSKDLAEYLAAIEERPWPEYYHGKPITQRQIAALLKPFEIRPKEIRNSADHGKGYLAKQFGDAFARYLTFPLPKKGGWRSATGRQTRCKADVWTLFVNGENTQFRCHVTALL
jgi:Protein of unknown function (DUF3631)